MADIFQWIQAATIAQDETTKAILVKLGSDVDIGDVHLLDTGDAKIDPATKGRQDTIIAALQKLTGQNYTFGTAVVNAAAGDQREVVAAPGENKQIWLMGYRLSADGSSGTWHWESGSTDKTQDSHILAKASIVRDVNNPELPLFKCGTNQALNLFPTTVSLSGGVRYVVVDV